MKRLLSEVKAASEKQQTNARHRDGKKVSAGGGGGGRGGETDCERRLAKDHLTSPQNKNSSALGLSN